MSTATGTPTVGIVAGEASGDALGAALIEALRARAPHVRFVGIAGPRMEAAGCEPWYPLEALSVRGLVEVLGRIPELVAIRRDLRRRLLAERVPSSSASTRRISISASSASSTRRGCAPSTS